MSGPPPSFQYQVPPPQPGGGSGWLGAGIVAAVLAIGFVLASSLRSELGIGILLLGLPLLLVAGLVMVAIPATRRTGIGILITVGAGVLILGGVCVALLAAH